MRRLLIVGFLIFDGLCGLAAAALLSRSASAEPVYLRVGDMCVQELPTEYESIRWVSVAPEHCAAR